MGVGTTVVGTMMPTIRTTTDAVGKLLLNKRAVHEIHLKFGGFTAAVNLSLNCILNIKLKFKYHQHPVFSAWDTIIERP